ncbi:MAG: hypothetical protein R2877_01260 [Bdellovibrionota bacterium]
MLIDISLLKKYPDFRWLFFGQFVSLIGSMISYVAVPYEIYQLTKNNAMVGALGVVWVFVPLVIFSLLGEPMLIESIEKNCSIISELMMVVVMMVFSRNATREVPSVVLIFVLMAILQALNGFHRPAMEAITQQIIHRKDYPQAEHSHPSDTPDRDRWPNHRWIGDGAVQLAVDAYMIDAVTFLVAICCLIKMTKFQMRSFQKSPLEDMKEGFAFAVPNLNSFERD